MLYVLSRTRIKQRSPGGSARAPIFDHFGLRLDAKPFLKILWRDLAKVFSAQQWNLGPDFRVIQTARINPVQPTLIEGRFFCSFEGDTLALALNHSDLGSGRRPAEIHTFLPSLSVCLLFPHVLH